MDRFQDLIEKVCQEGYEPGIAQEVMGNRNYWRGFELAVQTPTREQFHEAFNSQVVREYAGPWAPKARALEGARAAVRLGLTRLTERDIEWVSNYYKNKPIEEYEIDKLMEEYEVEYHYYK